jgi:hypothetical protein
MEARLAAPWIVDSYLVEAPLNSEISSGKIANKVRDDRIMTVRQNRRLSYSSKLAIL